MNRKKKIVLAVSNVSNHTTPSPLHPKSLSSNGKIGSSSSSSSTPLKGRHLLKLFCLLKAAREPEDSGECTTDEFTMSALMPKEESMTASTSHSTPSSARTTQVEEDSSCSSSQPPFPYQLEKHAYFEELGFMRSDCATMAEAQSMALACNKPLLAIEARIPGDSDAGRDVFSHPLIVEAARSLFTTYIRVIVSNEEDASVARNRATFTERSPSGKPCRTKVLFLDPHSGGFLANPLYGDFLICACMSSAMLEVIQNWRSGGCGGVSKHPPRYLSLLCEEEMGKVDTRNNKNGPPRLKKDNTACFATQDSAAAEVGFAALDGVLATRSAFMNGQRVVAVSYNSCKIAFCSLARHALKHCTANALYYRTNDERRAAEVEIARTKNGSNARLELFQPEMMTTLLLQADCNSKSALRKTPLKFVPLTDMQATKANRLVQLGRFNEAMHLLSPHQGMILMEAMGMRRQKQLHEVVDVRIVDAWISLSRQPSNKEQRTTSTTTQGEEENSDVDGSLASFVE